MTTITELEKQVGEYLAPDEVGKVRRAYEFGAVAHEGQRRLSGEPYIHHPLEVARILGDLYMDHQTLMAAILHDVVEDTDASKKEISGKFGKSVAELVDGVSKLPQLNSHAESQASRAESQARNFQKMLMAMSNDIRVIIVKLADRLHNMRTLGALTPPKRRRIARETLDIYAPIAQALRHKQHPPGAGRPGLRHPLPHAPPRAEPTDRQGPGAPQGDHQQDQDELEAAATPGKNPRASLGSGKTPVRDLPEDAEQGFVFP